jgi:hypothetical protein
VRHRIVATNFFFCGAPWACATEIHFLWRTWPGAPQNSEKIQKIQKLQKKIKKFQKKSEKSKYEII